MSCTADAIAPVEAPVTPAVTPAEGCMTGDAKPSPKALAAADSLRRVGERYLLNSALADALRGYKPKPTPEDKPA